VNEKLSEQLKEGRVHGGESLVCKIAELEGRLAGAERTLEAVTRAAMKLTDAMETCHVCEGLVLAESRPVHCEDCSGDCEDHDMPGCEAIRILHAEDLDELVAGLQSVSKSIPHIQVFVAGRTSTAITEHVPEKNRREALNGGFLW